MTTTPRREPDPNVTLAARRADLAATDYPIVPHPAPLSPSGRTMRDAIARIGERLAGGGS